MRAAVEILLFLVVSKANGFVALISKTSPKARIGLSVAVHETLDSYCHVAVFGGGFGGLYTALAISRESKRLGRNLDIALVEPTSEFVFLPLLYDLTVGTATERKVCPAYNDLLRGTGIRHVQASLLSLRHSSSSSSNTTTTISSSSGRSSMTSATVRPVNANAPSTLHFAAGVIAVGASPASILASVPGASQLAQPFYTATDAKQTRRLLNRLDETMTGRLGPNAATSTPSPVRIAIVGGDMGCRIGCFSATSIAIGNGNVAVSGPPMAQTRAEPLVAKALSKLGVIVEPCTVLALESVIKDGDTVTTTKIRVRRKPWESHSDDNDDETNQEGNEDSVEWDAVLWTAGSLPAEPVATGCPGLQKSKSGRLAVDATLRCIATTTTTLDDRNVVDGGASPRLWALGDCAEVVLSMSNDKDGTSSSRTQFPKTAQVAMQQAETVAANVLSVLEKGQKSAITKPFVFQDLGSMLTLGGPNAAVLAPVDGAFAPIFAPLLDSASGILGLADDVLAVIGRAPLVDQLGLPNSETLGLSLGSHGLGVADGEAPGTLAGTLSGAARRTIYAARMPTPQQGAVSLVSAALSTAAALAKEASERNEKNA